MYQVRIEHGGYDQGKFDAEGCYQLGTMIANWLTTFDGKVTVTVEEVEDDNE